MPFFEDVPLNTMSTVPPLHAGELRLVGVKQPESIGKISVRNDAAFLFSVVATTSVLAVVLGQLPGEPSAELCQIVKVSWAGSSHGIAPLFILAQVLDRQSMLSL